MSFLEESQKQSFDDTQRYDVEGAQKRLLDATQRYDVKDVRKLLAEGVKPNSEIEVGGQKLSPVHCAVTGESKEPELLELLELLLRYGANPNAKDDSGSMPLHYAARDKGDRIVGLLLDNWADLNAINGSGLTPLHLAIKAGKPANVRLLVANSADILAKDKSGEISLHMAASEGHDEMIELLLDQAYSLGIHHRKPTPRPKEMPPKPPFPIRINGNDLDEETEPKGEEAYKTEYILIQSQMPLSPSQRTLLAASGLDIHGYVSGCTYLCWYQGQDLKRVFQIDPIIYVDIYRQEFKISPDLKEARKIFDHDVEIFVVFHNNAEDRGKRKLRKLIKKLCPEPQPRPKTTEPKILCFERKAQLTVSSQHLDDIAKIDEVRLIEGVGKPKPYNNEARVILKLDRHPANNPVSSYGYGGEGQVIAIADTGLGDGTLQPHPAFGTRVKAKYPKHGSTEDITGHGTHTCGSAVGDGTACSTTLSGINTIVKGTAPGAELVIQSLWKDAINEISPPGVLTQLFEEPYTKDTARVHSNSWGTPCYRAYTTWTYEIDEFVWDKKNMVIFFAAGNSATYDSQGMVEEGQIGTEAIAKNCITVGACENVRPAIGPGVPYSELGQVSLQYPVHIRNAHMARSCNNVAAFSSRGPSIEDDSHKCRNKPDVVAPGTLILSARSASERPGYVPQATHFVDQNWCYMDGTSMATPLVAGCAAILFQAIRQKGRHSEPTAALIKALLINGADMLSSNDPIPNIHSGFGRVNLENSVKMSHHDGGDGFWEDDLTDNAIQRAYKIKFGGVYTALKVTLVWSDFPGNILTNELSLVLQYGTEQDKILSLYDNVQQILWCREFRQEVDIVVRATGKNLKKSPQPFAVAWQFS